MKTAGRTTLDPNKEIVRKDAFANFRVEMALKGAFNGSQGFVQWHQKSGVNFYF